MKKIKNKTNYYKFSLKKALKILGKILKVVVVLLVVLYGLAYWYISSHKKELVQQFSEMISEKIDGKVDLLEVDVSFFSSFPKISINAKNIMATDTMYKVHQHPFFKAEEFLVNVSLFKLIAKKSALTGMEMKNGIIYFYTDTSGYTNSYLIKSKKDSTGGPKKSSNPVAIRSVRLVNVQFVLNDEKREKLHDIFVNDLQLKLSDEGSWLNMEVKPNLNVKGLAFNMPNGTFLKDSKIKGKFLLKYEKLSQKLSFKDVNLEINEQDFVLGGSFDLGDKNPQFTLSINNEKTIYDEVKKILPTRIAASLSKVEIKKEFVSAAIIKGPLKGGEPLINASWNIKNADMKTIFMDFDNVSCEGSYSNEVIVGLPRKDPNSKILINNFEANWKGLPVKSSRIEILDLQHPTLTCDLQSNFEVKKLDKMLSSNTVGLNKGTVQARLKYSGPVEYNSETFAKLDGEMAFNNAQVTYKPRNVQLNSISGRISFKNTNVFLQDFGFNVLSNKINMNAEALGLVTLLNDDPNKVKIDYRIYAPQLNLNEFLFLFKARESISAKANSSGTFNTFSSKLDNILEKSKIELKVNADRIVYKNFSGNKFDADISILQDAYVIKNVSMDAFGGKMDLSGSIVAAGSNRHKLSLAANVNQMNVSQLMYGFDNFGQDGIISKELRGNISAKASVGIGMNSDAVILPSSANGTVSFSLKKGKLINFEPLKKIQKFVFKKRDFDEIEFAELKNTFDIKNGDININRMEIQSSVLSLFVEGLYSMKGNSDISIQVPLSNLNKRDEDYIPENIGSDKKGGRSIFLRGKPGSDGNIDFKLDLFKRYFKDNAESSTVEDPQQTDNTVPEQSKGKKGFLNKLKRKKKSGG